MDLFYGIDIASESFVVFNEERGCFDCLNNKKQIAALLKTLPEGAVLAVEATGGYAKPLADAACAKGFTVYMLQPARVKNFRKSGPHRSKTDKIDAEEIHEYVKVFEKRLHPYKPMPELEAEMRKLTHVRDGLVSKTASIRLQLRSLGNDRRSVEAAVSGLVRESEKIFAKLEEMLASAEDAEVLFSIPSVKTCTIAAVLPILRTIPFKDKCAFASYLGMDLVVNESGKFKGKSRLSKQGDKHARKALFMAAMSASTSKIWKPYYTQLLEVKKLKKKQALIALARKLLYTIFGVFRTQKKFVAPVWA